jgi:hypothetical protein
MELMTTTMMLWEVHDMALKLSLMYEFMGSEASGVSEGAARHYAHTEDEV